MHVKGKLLKRHCWLRTLVQLKQCHFLILWSILLQIVANYAKMIAFNNYTQGLCKYVEICRKIKTALPVYFLLPLSIFWNCDHLACWLSFTHVVNLCVFLCVSFLSRCYGDAPIYERGSYWPSHLVCIVFIYLITMNHGILDIKCIYTDQHK